MSQYLIQPPGLHWDAPEDDFPGPPLAVGDDGDQPWLPTPPELVEEIG
jgi:hypothetical protein